MKSGDGIPALLPGLRFPCSDGTFRGRLSAALEERMVPGARGDVGRPGMGMWRIPVTGVVRQGRGRGPGRPHGPANRHRTPRRFPGHADVWDGRRRHYRTLVDSVGHPGLGAAQWHSDRDSVRSDRKGPALRAWAGSRGLFSWPVWCQAAARRLHLLLGRSGSLGWPRPGLSRWRRRDSPAMIRATDCLTARACLRNRAPVSLPARRSPFRRLARMAGRPSSPQPASGSPSQRLDSRRARVTGVNAAQGSRRP